MSENTTETQAPSDTVEGTTPLTEPGTSESVTPAPKPSPPKEDTYVSALRDEAAEHRVRWRQAKKDAERLEAANADLQTQLDAATSAASERDQARLALTKYQVALDAGLDPRLAPRLTGTDEESIRADADQLKQQLGGVDVGQTGRPLATATKDDPLLNASL